MLMGSLAFSYNPPCNLAFLMVGHMATCLPHHHSATPTVVKVELMVPSIPSPPQISASSAPAPPAEDWVPVYSAREGNGERVVQFAA